jgi:hypothetical protein
MSDDDLRMHMAEIRTSLRHLEEDMGEAKADRRAMADELKSFVARLVALEGADRRLQGIPAQVAKNEKDNAVQEAMREAREHIVGELKRTVGLVLGVPGAVVAVAAVLALLRGLSG